jgi:Domain of unknown function (DUF3387)
MSCCEMCCWGLRGCMSRCASRRPVRRQLSKPDLMALERVLIKRILKRYGYPPDKRATELVMEQAEALCREGA